MSGGECEVDIDACAHWCEHKRRCMEMKDDIKRSTRMRITCQLLLLFSEDWVRVLPSVDIQNGRAEYARVRWNYTSLNGVKD